MIRFLLFPIIVFFALTVVAFASDFQTKAKQAILIDYQTGAVLFEKNADERMPTSSMSKVMTTYYVFDQIQKRELSLDQQFTVSEKAWKKGGSKMFVEVGKDIVVEDLLKGVIIQSGNDATIVLAEGISGDEASFATAITEKAKDIGMLDSNFTNASGWPDDNHYSTARDLATLGIRLVQDFPDFYPYYAEKEFTFNDIKQDNRNPLLYKERGGDGIKTGHTEAGGYGLIGSGSKDGRRVVFVINGLESEAERRIEGTAFLKHGLDGFENIVLFEADQIIADLDVALGKRKTIKVALNESAYISQSKNSSINPEVSIRTKSPLLAPIQKGDEVGTLKIVIPGQTEQEFSLKASEDNPKMGFIRLTFAKMGRFLLGNG